jgi:Lon protease-like protein
MSDSICEFKGKARLFPLPNMVFFPEVMQPLHIFEPRYRQMTRDALKGDHLIALVLPKPGWESEYAGAPAIHPIGCIGRIAAAQELDDGRYNILLRGLSRLRITEEISSKKLYRIARCELLRELPLGDYVTEARWRQILIDKAPCWFAGETAAAEQFRKLLESNLSLGALCDIITFAMPLDAEFKQTLLEELDVETRLQILHDFLEGKRNLETLLKRKFPPEFSLN